METFKGPHISREEQEEFDKWYELQCLKQDFIDERLDELKEMLDERNISYELFTRMIWKHPYDWRVPQDIGLSFELSKKTRNWLILITYSFNIKIEVIENCLHNFKIDIKKNKIVGYNIETYSNSFTCFGVNDVVKILKENTKLW